MSFSSGRQEFPRRKATAADTEYHRPPHVAPQVSLSMPSLCLSSYGVRALLASDISLTGEDASSSAVAKRPVTKRSAGFYFLHRGTQLCLLRILCGAEREG